MFTVTLTSIHGQTQYTVSSSELTEKLRVIGLERKTSDYLHRGEAIITIRPHVDTSKADDLQSALDKIGRIANGD